MMVPIIRGRAIQCFLAEPGSLEAVTGQRVKRKPGECDGELWVNQGAGGLGDALLGLCAVLGLRRGWEGYPCCEAAQRVEEVPGDATTLIGGVCPIHGATGLQKKTIIYKVSEPRIPLVALFDGGYDGLADHDWDATWDEFPKDCDPRDLQMNLGYKREIQHGAEITRLERYCRNLGMVTPELPTLRQPDAIMEAGKEFAGYVVLCPFTDLQSRDWPQFYWLTLEDILHKAGVQTVIVGSLRQTKPQRTDCFRSAMALHSADKPLAAETIAGILLNAACVVSSDSGLAHLAAIMGKRTVVLCGWSVGERIYSFYPQAVCLQGGLPCTGCWTRESKGFDEVRCAIGCDNLSTLLPQQVAEIAATA